MKQRKNRQHFVHRT